MGKRTAWRAWKSCGLGRIRDGASIEADPQGRIGCSLIAEARFFPPDQWVAAPADWKPRTQTGVNYQLSGTELALPVDAAWRPDVAALAWHREHRFLG